MERAAATPTPTAQAETGSTVRRTGLAWRLEPLRTPLAPREVVGRLDSLARRGELPGFRTLASGPGGRLRFAVSLFGEPFDRLLVGEVEAVEQGSVVRLRATLQRRSPAVLVGATALSLWPGVPMLDKMIPPSWGWWPTWWWAAPLVLVPTLGLAPMVWRRSERACEEHAREQLSRIAKALEAQPCADQPRRPGAASGG